MDTYTGKDEIFKALPETQKWTATFCGYYAQWDIERLYKKDDKAFLCPTTYVCSDKRRTNVVSRHLIEVGVRGYGTTGSASALPYEAKIRELGVAWQKAPEFNDTGYTQKEHSYSKDEVPVSNLLQTYKPVDRLTVSEVLYVWYHQDEYDFRIVDVTHKGNRYTSEDRVEHILKLFPKAITNKAQHNIFTARLHAFTLKHVDLTYEVLTGKKPEALQSKDAYPWQEGLYSTDHDGALNFEDEKGWNAISLDWRIQDVRRRISFYDKASKELAELQAVLDSYKDDTKFFEHVLSAVMGHLQKCAPLYMNSEDNELKELACRIFKGVPTENLFDTESEKP